MPFGKRDPDGWRETQNDLQGIKESLVNEENVLVRTALEQLRQNKLLTESLVPAQQDLWYRLFEAYKLGGVDLIRVNFQLSGMEIEDLLDLLYVANELIVYGEAPEYEQFEEGLLEFLQSKSGQRMDALLAEYFERYPSNADPQLIRLIDGEELVRSRLYDMLDIEADYLTQAVMSEGVIKLLEMEEADSTEKDKMIYIDEEDALKFLQRLMQDETILNDDFVELINKVQNAPTMFVLMDKIIDWLKSPLNANHYLGGFDSIGAAVVRKLASPGLVFTINSQSESLADERLLALVRMKSLAPISDAALMELLMEKDLPGAKNDATTQKKRSDFRQLIKSKKDFRPRLMELGIIGMFEQVSFPA